MRLFLLLGVLITALSCGRFGGGVRSFIEEPYPQKLSEWRLFQGDGASLKPNQGVVPYDLNTPLFSDYANKHRFVWMPAGTSAVYNDDEAFDFPVGTIISKTFAFPDDKNPGKEKLIETRLLARGKSGWVALPYVWNEDQTEAALEVAANPVQIAFTDPAGRKHNISYSIPNSNECAQCHERARTLLPIGPKARNLNKDFVYAEGPSNQLAYWTKTGYLRGAPSPEQAPKAPVWDDPKSGSLDARARAYLDNNCAHCHQPGGVAGYTGSLLGYNERDARKLGFFKLPNSAGYTGNRPYNIVPGKPEDSILLYRMESTRPKEMMPEIGRAIAHREGIELIREWLASIRADESRASR
jgi:uncharacterized repeat protein (TIGR03806 family)